MGAGGSLGGSRALMAIAAVERPPQVSGIQLRLPNFFEMLVVQFADRHSFAAHLNDDVLHALDVTDETPDFRDEFAKLRDEFISALRDLDAHRNGRDNLQPRQSWFFPDGFHVVHAVELRQTLLNSLRFPVNILLVG